ncbi:LOW QUALITY PROTEIN: endonuclease-reverse transcriptase [Elysia marginata]|uniref:Endonuclease-reverse transcriptase n=1 Tax=Elysia marginata TaxID=1093978 RepID=A0AAV4GJ98_9GAST|nr:LOW QUALITY PROTEIN: endonuclease-reverse transcriptase [Elysia marginata]
MENRAEQEGVSRNTRLVPKITNTPLRKAKQTSNTTQGPTRKFCFQQEGQLARWQEHFEQLLNGSPPGTPPPPANPPEQPIQKATKVSKSNKAAGLVIISPEALKTDTPTLVDIFHDLFENVWEQQKLPR